jgi:lysozyme
MIKSRVAKGTAAGAAAIALIGGFEGLRNYAYRDPVGIPTICFGETRGVKMGDYKTTAECKAMLAARLPQFEQPMRACLINPDKIADGPYIASLSLTYNIGPDAFCKSSVAKYLNAGMTRDACDAFMKFNRARGMVLPGLVKRRAAEREVCLKGKL